MKKGEKERDKTNECVKEKKRKANMCVEEEEEV